MLYFKFIQIVLLKLCNNLIKLIISVKNVLIKVEQMMVVVQVDLVFAAHVSFTLLNPLFDKYSAMMCLIQSYFLLQFHLAVVLPTVKTIVT